MPITTNITLLRNTGIMKHHGPSATATPDFLSKTFEKIYRDSLEAQRAGFGEKALLFAGALMALSHAYPEDTTLVRLLQEQRR
jgi:hypothetical protein